MSWCSPKLVHQVVTKFIEYKKQLVWDMGFGGILDLPCITKILFLDNVDIRSLNKPHSIVPRIKVFEPETMRNMIFMCSNRDQSDFTRFAGIRSPAATAYMRHTYQSPHSSVAAGGSRTPVPMAVKPISGSPLSPASVGQLTPQTFAFNQPSDLATYIRLKYPGLDRTYAMDYIKMYNAQLMQEVAKIWVGIICRNAELVDWVAQHVGSTQLQLIHRRPTFTFNSPDPNIPTGSDYPRAKFSAPHPIQPCHIEETSTANSGSAAGIFAAKCSSTFDDITKPKKMRNITDIPATCDQKNASAPSCNLMMMSTSTLAQHQLTNQRSPLDTTAPAPSFDLGIDDSPIRAQYVTPKANVFPIITPTSPVPYQEASPPQPHISSGSKQLTPRSSTKQNAYNFIIDHVDVEEAGIDRSNKVLYMLPVDENFVKITIPPPPAAVVLWKDCHRHPPPDPEAVEMLYHWCTKSPSDEGTRWWVIHSFPRYLWLSGNELKDNLLGSMLIIPDAIDLLIRWFNQLDDANKKEQSSLRWRHFLKSSFSMLSIGDLEPEKCQSILNQFVNLHHSVAHCSVIVIPLLVDDTWCAYMLNMNTVEVHILDPAHSKERRQLHVHFFKVICTSLVRCIEQFFDDWEFNPHDEWELIYPKLCSDSFSSEDSGICMLHFARYFNNENLEFPITQDMIPHNRMSLLYEGLAITGNDGQLPSMVKRML